MDRLSEAQAKLALGVPRNVVLTELGYGELAAVQAMAESAIAPAAAGGKASGGNARTRERRGDTQWNEKHDHKQRRRA